MAGTQQQGGQERESIDIGPKEDQPRRGTPEEDKGWDGFKDIRGEKDAGDYPNYWSHKTRSGHSFIMDDSDGKESVTLQHRSGAAIQMLPNGAMNMTTHNGQYNVVFGENRVTISGAQDITVKGDASMRVYGDYNITVHGNMNTTVTGDYNITAKNRNQLIRGNMDTIAKNKTEKLSGNKTTTVHGSRADVTKKTHSVISHSETLHQGGATGMNAAVKEGDHTTNIEKGNTSHSNDDGTYDLKVKNAIKILSESGAMHMIAQEAANILSKQGNLNMKAEQGDFNQQAGGGMNQLAGGDMKITAGGATHMKAAGGHHHDAQQTQMHEDTAQPASEAENPLKAVQSFLKGKGGTSEQAVDDTDHFAPDLPHGP
jgi:hypothetical protein